MAACVTDEVVGLRFELALRAQRRGRVRSVEAHLRDARAIGLLQGDDSFAVGQQYEVPVAAGEVAHRRIGLAAVWLERNRNTAIVTDEARACLGGSTECGRGRDPYDDG